MTLDVTQSHKKSTSKSKQEGQYNKFYKYLFPLFLPLVSLKDKVEQVIIIIMYCWICKIYAQYV